MWRHIHVSKPTFRWSFFCTIRIPFYPHSPCTLLYKYFMCHCIDYKLSSLQVRIPEQNTQRYDRIGHSCKILGCTNVSSNTRSPAQVYGRNGAHQGFANRNLQNNTRTEKAHEYAREFSIFVMWLFLVCNYWWNRYGLFEPLCSIRLNCQLMTKLRCILLLILIADVHITCTCAALSVQAML